MFRHLGQFFGKKLQSVPHFTKKYEKSSIWPKLATLSRKLPCFVAWVKFSEKRFLKVPHFAKKHEKSSIWTKRVTFLSTLLSIGVWVNFEAKG